MRYLYFCKVGDFVIEIYYDWKVGSIINRFTYETLRDEPGHGALTWSAFSDLRTKTLRFWTNQINGISGLPLNFSKS